jgi:hypothetical protein
MVFRLPASSDDVLSLKGAKELLERQLPKGAHCPCCGQYAKIYKRKFSRTLARTIVAMFGLTEQKVRQRLSPVIHVPTELSGMRDRDMGLLEDFGLVSGRSDGQTYSTGFWKITVSGAHFVRGEWDIPEAVYSYNQKVIGYSEERITIEKAWGTAFRIEDVMAVANPPGADNDPR